MILIFVYLMMLICLVMLGLVSGWILLRAGSELKVCRSRDVLYTTFCARELVLDV